MIEPMADIYKWILFCLVFFWAAQYGKVRAQGILAGDTLTPGIIFVDMDNVSLSANWPEGTDCAEFDFNNDGVMDLRFCNSVWSTMGASGEHSNVYPLNNAQIVYYEPDPTWVAELPDGAWIYSGSGWGDGGVLRYEDNFPDTAYFGGVFSNGYLGFRVDSIYGWVYLHASASSITIMEYAFQSNITTIDDPSQKGNAVLFPIPASNMLHIQLPEDHTFSEAIITDLQNRIVFRGLIAPGRPDHTIAVSSLHAGIYLLRLNGQNPSVLRFVKK